MPENRRKEFRELLAKRNRNSSEVFACSMGHLPGMMMIEAKLDERTAILARLFELQKEDPTLTDDNPDIHGACADNILFMRKHPFIRKLIELGGMMT